MYFIHSGPQGHFHSCRTVGLRLPGGPAMTERVAFLMKDLVLLAAPIYLLKQDVVRVARTAKYSDVVAKAERAA
jgi:hypothetical protein